MSVTLAGGGKVRRLDAADADGAEWGGVVVVVVFLSCFAEVL